MSVEVDRRQHARHVSIATVLLGTALLATILGADVRERSALPEAAVGVRSSVGAAANMLSCFEGVQDDLFGAVGPDDAIDPTIADQALRRVETCDVDVLEERLDAVALPAPAPVTDAGHRALRRDIEAALAALRRSALEARSTEQAWEELLRARDAGLRRDVVVTFRASEAAYERAGDLLGPIEARVRQLNP